MKSDKDAKQTTFRLHTSSRKEAKITEFLDSKGSVSYKVIDKNEAIESFSKRINEARSLAATKKHTC